MTSIPSYLAPSGAGVLSALEQVRANPVATDDEQNKGTLADRLIDQVQISDEARNRLAKDKEASDELSGLSEQIKKSVDSQQDSERDAKKDELRREIEVLKQQLRMAGPEQAEALARKLGQLAADLKQLAGDTASAGSSAAVPIGATSGQSAAQPATVTDAGTAASESDSPALSGADSLTSAPVNAGKAPAGQSEINLTQSSEPQAQNAIETSNQPAAAAAGVAVAQSEDTETPPTDREKTADAFEQLFAERQQSLIESEGRRQETEDLKFLARELKLLAIQVEDKLEQQARLEEKDQLDQGSKDLKQALKDIDEVLSAGNDILPTSIATPPTTPVAPIAQVQTYINIQEINVNV